MPITLAELLESRDKRVEHQKDLLGANPGKSLLCLTVQLPGPEKRNETSLKIAKAGVEAIRKAFLPEYEELKDLETGYEAYFLVDLQAEEAKRKACEIEDSHPLGRLMDIDVLYSPLPVVENYFSQGFAKNQFSTTSTNPAHQKVSTNSLAQPVAKNQFSTTSTKPTHPMVSINPPVSGNYFSGRDPKNQFPETSTEPARIEAISRLDIGLEARRCLLCGNEVRYCMRAKSHSRDELLSRIEQMIKEYELQAPNPRTD